MFTASLIMIVLNIILGSQFKVTGIIISRAATELYMFLAFGYFVKKIISKYNMVDKT